MDKTQTTFEYIDSLKNDYYKLENSEALHTLYTSNTDDFHAVYKYMTTKDDDYRFLLLAVMIHYGDGLEELDKEKDAIIELWNKTNDFKDGVIITELLQGKTLPDENIFQDSHLHYRNRSLVILSCFYSYIDEVKTIYNYLYKNTTQHTDHHNFNYLSDCFLVGQVQYMKGIPLELINDLLSQGIYTLKMLFLAYSNHTIVTGWGDSDHLNAQLVSVLVRNNQDEAIKQLEDIQDEDTDLISRWIDMLYTIVEADNYTPLIPYLSHNNHILRKKCKELILPHENNIRQDIEDAFSKSGSKFLKEIIEEWNDDKSLISHNEEDILNLCKNYFDKKKMGLIDWIPEEIFEGVKFSSGKKAAEAAQFIIVKYLLLNEPKQIKICDDIVVNLQLKDLKFALHKIYDLWYNNGCNPKQKMIVVPFVLYGADNAIDTLAEQIPRMFKTSRSALATLSIKAIALKESEEAIKTVGNMALYKEWTGAKESIEELSKKRNISIDELEDIITPDFGFDKNGIKAMQHGNSLFHIKLGTHFGLSIMDESGNIIKNVQAAIPDANTETIDKAKKGFSELKKQIQEVSKMQLVRLSKVLINGRKWERQEWQQLFMEHPLMKIFSYYMLWGAYKGDKLITPFIVSLNNQIIDINKTPYSIPEKYRIGLVHPAEMELQQVNELYQTLPECDKLIYYREIAGSISSLSDSDLKGNKVIKYRDRTVTKDIDILKTFDAEYHNSIAFWDIHGFYFRDRYLDIEAILKCTTHYKTFLDTTFGELVFYRYTDRKRYEYEQITDRLLLNPRDLPKRFVKSVLSICDKLTTYK